MKLIKFIIPLILLSLFSYGQDYSPFPDSNAVWVGTDGYYQGCNAIDEYNLFINGDTIINGLNYHKLYRNGQKYADCPPPGFYYYGEYYGAFRNDSVNKKVYFYNYNKDTLAYDFNLNKGDTLPVSYLNGLENSIIIDNIDSVYVYDKYRKRYNLTYEGHSFDYIIEGIGSSSGAFSPLGGGWSEIWWSLECFIKNENFYWHRYSNQSECILLGINEKQINFDVSIYPNPSKDFINVVTQTKIKTIEIINFTGKTIKKTTENKIIDIQDIPKGFYLVVIKSYNNLERRIKIVKE